MNVHTMLAILNYTYMDIFLKAVNVRNNGGLIKWQFSILSGIDGESLPYNTIQGILTLSKVHVYASECKTVFKHLNKRNNKIK